MDRLEKKVEGVRIGPREAGSEGDYSMLLEIMREIHERKTDLKTYEKELFVNQPRSYFERHAWKRKVALVLHAQNIAKTLGGKLSYNPQNEGIYVDRFREYTEHGQGD
jgi:hypothetical protein